jgi:hypothetical protein
MDAIVIVAAVAGGAKRRHLDDVAPETDMRKPEPPPDQAAVAEQLFHLLRMRVRDDVEILRMAVEQQVAHASADNER